MMARQTWLPTLTAVFVTSLILSNIIAVKLISVGPFLLTAAILIFPCSSSKRERSGTGASSSTTWSQGIHPDV